MGGLERCQEFGTRAGAEWDSMDVVRVVIVDNHEVLVARGRRGEETAGLVGMDGTSDGVKVDIEGVGAGGVGVRLGVSGVRRG